MSNPTFGRRPLLVSVGLGVAAWLGLPAQARPADGRIALPLDKLKPLDSVGGSVVLKVKDRLLMLVRDSATNVRALDPVCTHRQCVVAFDASANRIKCPCHGSQFDLNGKVLHGPATQALRTYATELSGGRIIVTL